jgi:hypothetical protein
MRQPFNEKHMITTPAKKRRAKIKIVEDYIRD